MDEKPIHMVKAAFHTQFKTAMESQGIEAGTLFKSVGLPADIEDPDSLLPEGPFWRLINMVALEHSVPDFGMRVALVTPWHRVESLAPLLRDCSTLKNLLDTFCKLATSQASNVVFDLQRDPAQSWFSYFGEIVFKRDVQMELYRITSMIDMVRQAAGTDWHPARVRLMMPQTSIIGHCSILSHSSITFSSSTTAVSLEPGLLDLPVEFTNADDDLAATTQNRSRIQSDFETSIRKIIESYSPNSQITIDDLARLTDMSVRTLQRRLTAQNLQFKQLLNQARFSHASEKLKKTRLPIARIARSMGYSDAAHFTRAFRRWAGVTPREFRKQLGEHE